MESYRTQSFPEPIPNPHGEKGWGRAMKDIVETLILSLVLFLGINTVSARIRVESISMQPTLYAGDFVIVNKLAYKLGTPGRGDVIIFRFPPAPQQVPYVKRVIGLPGDVVTIQDGKVSVNGVFLQEPYIKESPRYEGTWQVPESSLFVLGDNRNSSSDSHSWGMVPVRNIIGKAEFVYWPPSEWKALNQVIAVAASP